ncbi:MAG: multiprotein bridging factor aMBF1, partial [Ferroplasma sp.]
DFPKLIKVKIEGTVLNVCPNCSKFGVEVEEKEFNKISKNVTIKFPEKKINVVTYKKPFKKTAAKKRIVKKDNIENLEVVEDYAELIKNRREELSMTQDELALKVSEGKNVISKIERNAFMPNIEVARKLERTLNIKLLESV